jgi:hypothetical protein
MRLLHLHRDAGPELSDTAKNHEYTDNNVDDPATACVSMNARQLSCARRAIGECAHKMSEKSMLADDSRTRVAVWCREIHGFPEVSRLCGGDLAID